ncbi:MAG: UTP--glucose-1-phosphate uridylyltransferase [Alphaproteobacteria bacterium RIFCSPLOWO2_01_FULL_40_26]|nr:MAG: UTP--glucose-1-phosphate uridylyltransferase [Alphaproteobacteria bacterium RIFCSPHIGHO2_02_FULL_40_34]OFW95359.1 MAG: UTP--glucose-1-phosphate uridylyltransferase [Alphaproteobacteria bacterium RIFCSPLOWO2_01_FULL_40_26]OFX09134.1 MAG: UTP--glucose-1-phosphate uridylyltransferase [Alphaproteobacteria bacterium RIFCSPLOWO2_02_FULL_40_19]OFX10747.1 MAG: UTP--glucose-1-phosphate uridylyltransferase [Alphaproteobacteria bacterium RIFCSPLOWO2_12_FULL_40_11]
MRRVKTAVFPVGGLGTRFLPATKSMPKEMLPIANKPIIQYAYEEAKAAGIEKFIFVTGRNKNAINNHFDHAYELESKLDEKNKSQELNEVMGWLPQAGQVAFVRQQKPLGLGHSIWCARNFIAHDEAFIVILADEMMMQSRGSKKNFLGEMIDLYYKKEESASVVAVDEIKMKDSNKYGIIKIAGEEKIVDMIEKPKLENAPSNLAITGRYILQPEIFEYLSKFEIGSGGEIQLTDAMKAMCKNFPYYYKKIDEVRFDCGNVLGYLEANIAFAINNDMVRDEVKKILKKYL